MFFTDDNLVVKIDHVRIPVGYGRRSHIGKSSDKYYKLHERSIFSPNSKKNDFGMCLAVTVLVGIAHSNKDINRYNYLTYSPNYNELIRESRDLCFNACVDLSQGGGVDEIIQFQQYLGAEYRIVVFGSLDGKEIIFKACHDEYKYQINILLDDDHYSLILSPTAVFAVAYFCGHCCIGYTAKLGHKRCRVKCNSCFQSPPCAKISLMKCSLCNREFVNANCFQNHIRNKLCEKYKVCLKCYTVYSEKNI